MTVIFDEMPEKKTNREYPGFPWLRFDNRKFIWEEALYHGNYVLGSSSAMGCSASRERITNHMDFMANKSHFNAFELEIDGLRLRDRFEFKSQQSSITPEGFEHHISELYYPIKKAIINVHTLLDGSSFMVRWLEIINIGNKPFAITGCFPLCGMLACEIFGNSINLEQNRMEAQVGAFKDNYYLGEGEFFWQEIPKASLVFGHERGEFNPPMYIIKNNSTCEHTVIQIETSILTQAEFYRGGEYRYARIASANNDYIHFKVGIDKRSCYNVVNPGEIVNSPKIHISQIYGDIDNCVNELNIHLRSSIIPKQNNDIVHPVKYNHTGYTLNNQITKQALLDEVDMAAEIGSDIFLVDAGWFGAENKVWAEVVGDWYENQLLENSLGNVFDYARKKGMKCGLWMEIEGIKFSSLLAQEHPDWFCSAYNSKLPVLNILKPEVEEFIYNIIVTIIEKYKLECFRIDGGLKEPIDDYRDDCIESTSWKYFDKLHKIYEKVYKKFPYLYMENCSGGGGRSDQSFLRHFHWVQLTDLFAPVSQLRVLYGMSLALAPEQCYTICGAFLLWPTHPNFMARVGFFGQMGISGIAPHMDKKNPEFVNSWKHTIELYKNEMRPILSTCKVYHHTPLEDYQVRGQWIVLEYAAQDASKSIIGLFRLEGSNEDEYLLRPKGIALDKKYDVYFDNTREIIIVSGWELHNNGIRVVVQSKLMSEILIIKENQN